MLIPLAFAWVALLPPGGWGDGSKAFTRVALVLLETMMVLHIYPVAGTQIEVAAMTAIPVGGLILADGVAALRMAPAWSIGSVRSERVVGLLPALLIGVLAVFAVTAVLLPARTWIGTYRANDPLGLKTTRGMRLPPGQTAAYRAVAAGIKQNCRTLITMPGSTSFYIWTGLKPPDGFNSSDWVYLLDDRESGHTYEQVKNSQSLCLIANYSTLAVWRETTRLGPLTRIPLTNFIDENRWKPLVVTDPSLSLVLYKRVPPGKPGADAIAPGY
jgi:hypothetical protein